MDTFFLNFLWICNVEVQSNITDIEIFENVQARKTIK